jgi:hypothetical protein
MRRMKKRLKVQARIIGERLAPALEALTVATFELVEVWKSEPSSKAPE